jgi:hypothetical protein
MLRVRELRRPHEVKHSCDILRCCALLLHARSSVHDPVIVLVPKSLHTGVCHILVATIAKHSEVLHCNEASNEASNEARVRHTHTCRARWPPHE